MSLNRPILDDRSYEQLRDELLSRIPVYAPEWTDHNASDPGVTLIELFSYLGENLLYRFNQIPDATKIEFLRLLQIPLRPAKPAHSMVSLITKESSGVAVQIGTTALAGDVAFETVTEVRALPLTALAVSKARSETPPGGSEAAEYFKYAKSSADVTTPLAYKTALMSPDASTQVMDFGEAVDGMMWLAVLAEKAELRDATLAALASHKDAPLLLNLGFVPDVTIEQQKQQEQEQESHRQSFTDLFRCPGEGASSRGAAVQWQISTSRLNAEQQPEYRNLSTVGDSSEGLSREGVVRLQLPRDLQSMGPFNPDDSDQEGVGELPPLLDDEELEGRLLFWLRAFRLDESRFGRVLYVGANATELVQTVKARTEVLGTGNGQPNQSFPLVHRQVVPGSLILEVEELDGWRRWQEVDNFHASSESALDYVLDAAAGQARFGNGLNGYAPQIGQRIRAVSYRYGGGAQGNVASGAINRIKPNLPLKVSNPLPAYGGADAEALEVALERIPAELRRRDRAVTSSDFKELALLTPGGNIGRAECLPRFHPDTPDTEAAGVVSVVVWPSSDARHPDAPMPDRNQQQLVCRWLDARRLVTTEHYVLPPSYRPIAVAVGVVVKQGYGVDAVRHWVEQVIRQYLAPLPPFGPSGEGWPLGRRVHGPELEAAALQVEGVEYLSGLEVVAVDGQTRSLDREKLTVDLHKYEVVELTSISVEEGDITVNLQNDGSGGIKPPGFEPGHAPVPVPVIKEVC